MVKFYKLYFGLFLFFVFSLVSISLNAQNHSSYHNADCEPSNCISAPDPIVVTQADNTQITIIGKGNMTNSWAETIDGFSIKLNNGVYEYAQKVNGELVASGVKANDPSLRNAVEQNFISTLTPSLKPDFDPIKSSILNQVNAQIQSKTYPSSGHVRVLALLIDYPDLQATHTVNEFDSILGGSGTGRVHESFKTYYEVSSDSQLTISVDVMGWYRADSSYIYYGRDSGYARAADLVREAVDAAEIQGVNYANYDNDNNGRVDGILVVHSGQGAEQGSQTQYIWSHRWVMAGGNLGSAFYDGVTINDYIMNPEVTIVGPTRRLVGIGVFAHEFGHNLGLPDLYDTDPSNGNSAGIGNWDIMAGGTWLGIGYAPGDFSAWCKEELGWITPTNLTIGNSGNHSLLPTTQNISNVYRINTNLNNEYFLLENRKKTKLDSLLPGEGMAIWHINTDKTNSFGNRVNGDVALKGVDLEEADGLDELDSNINRGNAGDLYPGITNNTSFNSSSTPNSNHYTNDTTGLNIWNIAKNGDTINFNFGPVPPIQCSGTTILTTSSGNFDNGSGASNYANNLNCSWSIQVPTGMITLTFSSFDTEAGVDTVNVYDGTDSSASLLGRFSGNAIPPTIVSSSNNLYISFKTDASNNASGWSASYVSGVPGVNCGTDTLTASSATFNDGSGTQNYTNNLFCSWLIQPIGANIVRIEFDSLSTELGNDTVAVYDGPTSASPLLGVFSGTNLPPMLNSSGASVFVTFTTNGSITDKGFQISYEGISSCSGVTSLTAASGTFSDGTRSNQNYFNNLNCQWIIEPTGATFISLNFDRFNTENGFDFVEVYDGRTTASPRLGRFSGNSIPSSLQSTGGEMLVLFRTDGSVVRSGWEISYNSTTTHCLQNSLLTGANGTLSDGSGTNNYDNNLNCSWLIQPPLAATITLNFTAFNTESNNDEVKIYDGTDATGTLLATYSGNSIPSNVTANSGSMFVEFTTNGSITAAGWDASYTSTSNQSCSGVTTFTTNSGSFDDGSGTSNYDNDLNCGWLIQPSSSPAIITLTMNAMNLANFGDRVRVFDGTSAAGTLIAVYNFNNTGSPVVATSGSMFVEFVTDNNFTAQGWSASYNSSSTFCLPTATLTANIGTITDGSPTGVNYANNTDCEWLIQPTTPNQNINLSFSNFQTEAGNDTVTIYDGSTTSAPVLGTFSGSSIPPALNSTGGSMLVTFKTNGSNTALGWRAVYRVFPRPFCSGLTTLTNASGTFNDGSSNSVNYVANSNCSWLIQPAGAVSISLNFNYFTTQANFDILSIYDGTDNTAPSLGTFSGTTLPSSILSTSGAVFIEFTTNAFIEANGWEISYTSSNTVNISTNPDTVFINAGLGSSGSFNVTSNTSWTTADNANWLIVTPFSSQANQTGSVQAIQGNTGAPRIAEVYVSSTLSSVSDTFIVVQRASGNFLNVTPKNLSFIDAPTVSQNVSVNASVSWNATSSAPWLSIAPSSGTSNGTVAVSAQNNIGSVSRNGFIVFTGGQGVPNDTVFITQDAASVAPSQLSVNPSNLTLAQAMGSNASFTVNSNVVWQTNSGATWLTVTNPTTTSDTNTVQIAANTMNASTSPRSTYVAVQNVGGTLFDTVFVTQLGASLVLSASPNNVSLNQPLGSTASVNLSSNTDWVASAGDLWLTSNPLNGNGNSTLTISSLSANTTTSPRTSYIALRDVSSSIFDTIFVVQNGINSQLSVFPKNLFLAATANSIDSFVVNSNVTWQTLSGATWLTSVNPINTTDTNTVRVIANTANPGTSSRSTYVEVRDINSALVDTVFVQQFGSAPILEGSPDTIVLGGNTGSTGFFQLVASATWTINNSDTWLTINPTNGTGSQTINLQTNSNNPGSSIRVAKVILDDAINNLSDTVIVIQDTLRPGLSTTPDTIRLGNANGSLATFDVSSPDAWTATPNDTWIDVNPTNSVGNLTVTVIANSANPNFTDRITFILVTALLETDTVYVIQEGVAANLSVSPSTLNLGFSLGSNDDISVSSNQNWTVTNPVTWLSLNVNSGSGNGTVTVTTNSDNLTGATRTANLTFSAPGLADRIVTVNQIDGSNPTFTLSRDTVYVANPQGSTATFSVLSNIANWTLVETTPWMVINPQSGSNTQTITILAASRNAFGNDRSAIITASANGFADDTIVVIQRGASPLFQVAPANVTLGPEDQDVASFNLSSNLVLWDISKNATWMDVSPSSGAFTQQIRITATETNNTGNIRSDILTISAPPLVPQAVLVTQDTLRVTSINELRLKDIVSLYPNPSSGQVNLILPVDFEHSDLQLKLYSVLGTEVSLGKIVRHANRYELNLNSQSEGIYFLRMVYRNQIVSKKIIIAK